MASFFYTLNYVWNLYKGIKEKYYSCMDGYSVQVHRHICPAARAAKRTQWTSARLVVNKAFRVLFAAHKA